MAQNLAKFQEHVDNLASISRAKAFLGKEFLTWLWYVSEKSKSLDGVAGKYEVDIWVDDRLVLESSSGKSHVNSLKGGEPSQSREAAIGLSLGKTVKELKLGVNVRGVGEYTAVLNSDGFSTDGLAPKSVKLPTFDDTADGDRDDEDSPTVTLRLKQTQIFVKVLDGLFAKFMDERSSDKWENDSLAKIKSWIKTRREASGGENEHAGEEGSIRH
jgi:hypothetical protein